MLKLPDVVHLQSLQRPDSKVARVELPTDETQAPELANQGVAPGRPHLDRPVEQEQLNLLAVTEDPIDRLIDGVQKHFPKATFFLAWHANWGLGRNRNTKQLLEHPWIVNREDLPREFAAGRK